MGVKVNERGLSRSPALLHKVLAEHDLTYPSWPNVFRRSALLPSVRRSPGLRPAMTVREKSASCQCVIEFSGGHAGHSLDDEPGASRPVLTPMRHAPAMTIGGQRYAPNDSFMSARVPRAGAEPNESPVGSHRPPSSAALAAWAKSSATCRACSASPFTALESGPRTDRRRPPHRQQGPLRRPAPACCARPAPNRRNRRSWRWMTGTGMPWCATPYTPA